MQKGYEKEISGVDNTIVEGFIIYRFYAKRNGKRSFFGSIYVVVYSFKKINTCLNEDIESVVGLSEFQ